MGPAVTEIWSGGQNKKKVSAYFYFSTGAFFIASVDPPFKESTDPGLTIVQFESHFIVVDYTLWPFWVDTHVDPPFRKAK